LTPARPGAQGGRRLALAAVAAAWVWAGVASAAPTQPPAEAGLGVLEAELVSGESATAILGRWCAGHALADPPRILALRDLAAAGPADDQVRRLLRARPGEAVGYRKVRLVCGTRVLSEADNWFLPGRLTPEMNHALETTDTPFGQVVRPTGFHRVTLEADQLWPRGRPAPAILFRVQAHLVAADGRPISLVRESYRRELLP
jgi:hypothetical protein